MKKLSLAELGRISEREYKKAEKVPVEIILDNIRSGYNVGSFFRSVDAFRLSGLHLCGITAQPHHKEILKTAIGAEDTVRWKYYERVATCIQELKSGGYEIIGIEQTDESIGLQELAIDKNKSYGIVFGNEVDGISQEILTELDLAVEIPQYGTKHSFNVSVCGGIVMWEFAKAYREL